MHRKADKKYRAKKSVVKDFKVPEVNTEIENALNDAMNIFGDMMFKLENYHYYKRQATIFLSFTTVLFIIIFYMLFCFMK